MKVDIYSTGEIRTKKREIAAATGHGAVLRADDLQYMEIPIQDRRPSPSRP
jgi:hypothetical protein